MRAQGTILRASAMVSTCVLLFTLYVGRGEKVQIKQDDYAPALGGSFSQYKGKPVFLASVNNEANNTTIWYYYNPEQTITYEAWPSLTSYFWYCLKRALESAGMRVYENDKPAGVPEVEVTLESLTDVEFTYLVRVRGRGSAFKKQFTVTMAPAKKGDADYLVKRAYSMIDKMAKAMLGDKEFARAFSAASKAR